MEKEVVVSEPGGSSSSFTDSKIICRVCQKQFSQYTCPRCNIRYCSLPCYKGHSLWCTESFMRDNVMDELQQMQPEEETKRKMMDILKRFHSEGEDEVSSDNEDEPMLSEELIQKVISGDEIRLEDLSPEEIKRFKRALASGELSKLIEPWTPWWTKSSAKSISLGHGGRQLITQINTEPDPSNNAAPVDEEIPPGPDSPLPQLNQLTRSEPSPFLAVHLVDVLYGYCFTLRLYNGDWSSDPLGSASVFLTISKVMGDDFRPETVREALISCLEQACSPVHRHMGGFNFAIGLMDDVISLISLGSNALVCALCDLRRMVQAGEKEVRSEKAGKREKAKFRGVERKMYFLMCWVHEQPHEAWSSLAGIVGVEKDSLFEAGQVKGDSVKAKPQSKLLIEEV
ncbi:HIT zinc finger family protein [Rhynchospora pubera]|uniref:HIT zinc finger family protein n=1 Tax=Rhynchospora pubera TaxID=906938 RepID=A0AAV8GCV9_9POAL|nr:HIT zinc finger family protein [Rhynchospora pubera]